MEEQWGGQEFLGRVEWEGGGFERGKEFLEERESVLSWMVLSVLYFLSVLDKESTRKYLPINV